MPVNFKFVIEGMEEAGSLGLEKLLQEDECFFSDVDYVVISDNLWLSNKKPALTYGSRGNACFFVEVKDTGSLGLGPSPESSDVPVIAPTAACRERPRASLAFTNAELSFVCFWLVQIVLLISFQLALFTFINFSSIIISPLSSLPLIPFLSHYSPATLPVFSHHPLCISTPFSCSIIHTPPDSLTPSPFLLLLCPFAMSASFNVSV